MNIDVVATETNNSFIIEPISESAKLACRKHKGVVMKKYKIPKFAIDSIQEMYCNYGAICFEFNYN